MIRRGDCCAVEMRERIHVISLELGGPGRCGKATWSVYGKKRNTDPKSCFETLKGKRVEMRRAGRGAIARTPDEQKTDTLSINKSYSEGEKYFGEGVVNTEAEQRT